MRVLAIDPGTKQSGVAIVTDNTMEVECFLVCNENLVNCMLDRYFDDIDLVVIEEVRSYMQRIGQETLDTVFWSGRIAQVCRSWVGVGLITRKDVKKTVCGNGAAKDADVRAAMIDLYGGTKKAAIGSKHDRGPLYGVKKDMWQALGLAWAYFEGADVRKVE